MSKRSPKSVEEKCDIVQLLIKGERSVSQLAKQYRIAGTTVKRWRDKYQQYGIDGLKESHTWQSYTYELKQEAVEAYLDGKGALTEVCRMHDISAPYGLRSWIKRYTSGKEPKATSKGYSRMKQGRKTTFEERVEIVNYTIAHEKDYQAAIEKFGVSYQQVYSHRSRTAPAQNQAARGPQSLFRDGGWSAKKVRHHQTAKPSVRQGRYLEVFQAIKDYHEETPNFPIQTLCRILTVSRSGYDKWLKHPETPSERVNKELMATIKSFHHRYNGILGYRRMTAFVNRQPGTQYNKKRIRRLMHILGIRSVSRRVRHACTKSGDKYYEETILNRDFTATAPNQKWCTDVTYLQYGLGAKAYLSAIKDLYDGSIVAYEMSHNHDNPLVMKTIKKALALNPNARPLIHSDRGSQYTSKEYRYFTTQAGLTLSMSRVVKCIDNAPIESFFGQFKTESYHLQHYKTFEELVTAIDDYISFYTTQRYQEKLNNLTPLEFRNQVAYII